MIVGEWPTCGVTFATTRGSFVIDADMMKRAALTSDDFEIRRAFAKGLPFGARAYRKTPIAGGALRVFWRIVRVVSAQH